MAKAEAFPTTEQLKKRYAHIQSVCPCLIGCGCLGEPVVGILPYGRKTIPKSDIKEKLANLQKSASFEVLRKDLQNAND